MDGAASVVDVASSVEASAIPASVDPLAAKPTYPRPAQTPTQEGPRGVRFDFNLGARVVVPEGRWNVTLRDLDTGNILFKQDASASTINSSKRYFVRFRIEVSEGGEPVMSHDYSARDRDVLILFPTGTLGDIIAWFSYAARFGRLHGCRLTCAMAASIIALFQDTYPDIRFVTPDKVEPDHYYATYHIGLFFDDKEFRWQPCDFRMIGLHRTAAYILGVDPAEEAPRAVAAAGGRPTPEPYVCIAVQSTSQAKYWNNPYGWHAVVAHLRAQGYRVVCIDQKPVHGLGLVWNHIPHGVEDRTGASLPECVRWLQHAAFFVGLSSGLSWLAWAAGARVVMISGFSHPTTEFDTPYRVINYHACNSCWNDMRERFDHRDFLWCPRHKGTPRQFECTKLITADQVIAAIDRVPRGIPAPFGDAS